MTAFYDLPLPSDEELKRSAHLSSIIQALIQQEGGYIPFSRFMEMALYHPDCGYYQSNGLELGRKGDFTTAPEISPLFAHCIARQTADIFSHLPEKNWLELGAGSGRFAADLLDKLKQLDCLPDSYFIYEISKSLQKKQQKLLCKRHPDYIERIFWLDKLPDHFSGIIFGNEILDALPVHCFEVKGEDIQERCVSWEQNGFQWRSAPPCSAKLAEAGRELIVEYQLNTGYVSEINLNMSSLLASLSHMLNHGLILLADYGYGQTEYYHPQRSMGTMCCFYRHQRSNNPLGMPGLQDITAHVDFTRAAETAAASGCQLLGYTTQAAFLLSCGLLDLAAEQEKTLDLPEQFTLHQAIKTLTLPTEMGERIKIMGLGKDIDFPLKGFSLQDRRRDL